MSNRKVAAEVFREHAQRLLRVSEQGGVHRLRRMFDDAQQEQEAKLRRLARGGKHPLAAHQANAVLQQIRVGQQAVVQHLTSGLGAASRDAQEESLHGLARSVVKLEKATRGVETTVPIDEAARFWGVLDNRRSSLLRMHADSMQRYGKVVVGKMEQQLGLALLEGETPHQAIDRLATVADGEWWQAERIARTELAYAFNATHADGVREVAREVPGMMLRWCEHVDDETGQPLDDRVGADSIAMSGQVTQPGGVFTMPPDPNVSLSLIGKSWAFPPNRSNDRAVCAPWRKEWGTPGWVWTGGKRQYLAR